MLQTNILLLLTLLGVGLLFVWLFMAHSTTVNTLRVAWPDYWAPLRGGGYGGHGGHGHGGHGHGGHGHGRHGHEGFINFGADTSNQGTINVPLYSTTRPIVKVFDNLFFDTTNGNLVEVLGPKLDSSLPTQGAADKQPQQQLLPVNNVLMPSELVVPPMNSVTPDAPPLNTPLIDTPPLNTPLIDAPPVSAPTTVPVVPMVPPVVSDTIVPPAASKPIVPPAASKPIAKPVPKPTTVPKDFNWKQYLANYPDLTKAGLKTQKQAEDHWKNNGFSEKRTYLALPAKKKGFTSENTSDITGIVVVTRNNKQKQYTQSTGNNESVSCPESLTNSVESINSTFSYATIGTTTDKYLVCYAAWGTDTYVHVINVTARTAVCSQRFTSVANAMNYNHKYTNEVIAFPPTASVAVPLNPQTPTTPLEGYPHLLYQLSPTGYFDVHNGYLLLANPGDGTIARYDRYGGQVASTATVAASVPATVSFNTFSVVQDNILYVYMAFGKDTVIMLIRPAGGSTTSPNYMLAKVARFDETGMAEEKQHHKQSHVDNNDLKDLAPLAAAWLRRGLEQQQPQQTFPPPLLQQPTTTTTGVSGNRNDRGGGHRRNTQTGRKHRATQHRATQHRATQQQTTPSSQQPSSQQTPPVPSSQQVVDEDHVLVPKNQLLSDAKIVNEVVTVPSTTAYGGGGSTIPAGTASTKVKGVEAPSTALSATPSGFTAAEKRGGQDQQDGTQPNGQRKRVTVQGVDTHSAFGAMVRNPSNYRPMPAGIPSF